jgi:NAD(P)-dependent dehydrogenase (short-subunit alcohol dehydrogenase family)
MTRKWNTDDMTGQDGRTFVVTGANSGIGFEAARGLIDRGAHVVLAVRDLHRRELAAARLGGPGSRRRDQRRPLPPASPKAL